MSQDAYLVRAEWDGEANVWVATSDDVPGLVTEAENLEELRANLREIIPVLLEENASRVHKTFSRYDLNIQEPIERHGVA